MGEEAIVVDLVGVEGVAMMEATRLVEGEARVEAAKPDESTRLALSPSKGKSPPNGLHSSGTSTRLVPDRSHASR